MPQINNAFSKHFDLDLDNYFETIQDVALVVLRHCEVNSNNKAVFVRLVNLGEHGTRVSVLFSSDEENCYSLANIYCPLFKFAEIFGIHLAQGLTMFLGERTNKPWTVIPESPNLYAVIPVAAAKLRDKLDKNK